MSRELEDSLVATDRHSTMSDDTTWIERLGLNFISYSFILIPIAAIVLSARYHLLPSAIQKSVLIQWFVFGSHSSHAHKQIEDHESRDQLIVDDSRINHHSHKEDIAQSKQSNAFIFIWCFVGLQGSYLIWGVLQEKIMTTTYTIGPNLIDQHVNATLQASRTITFHDSQFLVFINRVIAFVLAIFAIIYHSRPSRISKVRATNRISHTPEVIKPQAPLYEFVYCSLSNILSSWCQYEALKYVSFPTQVLSKSCKIIPVMLLSKIMLRKRYQYIDYLCALVLSMGMFVFLVNQPPDLKHRHASIQQMQNNAISPASPVELQITPEPTELQSTSAYDLHKLRQNAIKLISGQHSHSNLASGLVILALYLAFDSFTSNWQQSLFERYRVTNWQMMAAANFYSIMLTLTSLHQLNNLQPALKLLSQSRSLLFDCAMMSIASSVGQLFVYYTIRKFGSVIFAVIMTMRQFFAILLSCAIYKHELTIGSCVGLVIVFMVVVFQMWRRSGGKSVHLVRGRQSTSSSLIQFKTNTT